MAAEPSAAMRARLVGKLDQATVAVEVVDAPAESLAFPDTSFDAAVSPLVPCAVTDPAHALAEVHRVRKPAGRLVLLEHVRATGFASTRSRPRRASTVGRPGRHT